MTICNISMQIRVIACLDSSSNRQFVSLGSEQLDLIPWSLESKAEGLKDITHVLHRLIGRLIAILNQVN